MVSSTQQDSRLNCGNVGSSLLCGSDLLPSLRCANIIGSTSKKVFFSYFVVKLICFLLLSLAPAATFTRFLRSHRAITTLSLPSHPFLHTFVSQYQFIPLLVTLSPYFNNPPIPSQNTLHAPGTSTSILNSISNISQNNHFFYHSLPLNSHSSIERKYPLLGISHLLLCSALR